MNNFLLTNMQIHIKDNKIQTRWEENGIIHYLNSDRETGDLIYYNSVDYAECLIDLSNYKTMELKNKCKFEIFVDYLKHTKVCN
jgi:hypothetical protein